MVGKARKRPPLTRRISANLVALRKRVSWTQAELAERSEVNAETISRYERGTAVPSLETLEQIASALNVGIGEIVDEAGPQAFVESDAVLSWLSGLADDDRRHALRMLKQTCEHLRTREP